LWEPHYYGKGNSVFVALHQQFVASAEVWLKFEVLKKSGIQIGQAWYGTLHVDIVVPGTIQSLNYKDYIIFKPLLNYIFN